MVYAEATHQLGYDICLVDSGPNIKATQTLGYFDSYLELPHLWSQRP